MQFFFFFLLNEKSSFVKSKSQNLTYLKIKSKILQISLFLFLMLDGIFKMSFFKIKNKYIDELIEMIFLNKNALNVLMWSDWDHKIFITLSD